MMGGVDPRYRVVDEEKRAAMWLPWTTAFWMASALVVALIVARQAHRTRRPGLIATGQEVVVVLYLYALWQYVRARAVTKVVGATENAHQLWRLEQRLHIASELSIQRALIDNRPIMQFLNIYYAVFHVPAMGAVLIWLFWRHREFYARTRTSLALLIAGCITMQAMIPMAPPRFLTDLGFVDAGLKYGLSVYGTGGSGLSNEVAAIPSLHAGWAILAGYAALRYSTSSWRWIVVLHTALTLLAIVATGNHWWLDAVVSAMILGLAIVLQNLVRSWIAQLFISGGGGSASGGHARELHSVSGGQYREVGKS